MDTFAEAGYEVPFDVVRPLIGMGADKLLPNTIGVTHDSEEGKKILARRSEIFQRQYLLGLNPLPGSRAFVLRVRADGLKPIVAIYDAPADLLARYETSLLGEKLR